MNEHQLFQFYLELKKNYVPVPANPKTVKNAPLFSQTSPNIAYQIDRDYDGFLNRGISYDYDEKTNQKVVDLLERISTSKYYHLSIVQENFDTVRFVARTVSIINGEKPVYHFVITFRKDEDISFTTYPQTEEERKEICKYEKMENGS
ncbi:MAG: hypothetical protein KH135_04010, partial [Firmicutes bacterium]|nr:hypothetical protein [Bacillota bacterium]